MKKRRVLFKMMALALVLVSLLLPTSLAVSAIGDNGDSVIGAVRSDFGAQTSV